MTELFGSSSPDSATSVSSRVTQIQQIHSTALELFTKKNTDYGDAFAEFDIIGILMRINDKIKRMVSITKTGIYLVNNEEICDTLLDLHNYAAMALMLLDEYYSRRSSSS